MKLVDWTRVSYLSLLQIYDIEKDWDVAKNIASACTRLGEPFIQWDSMGKVWRFAHQQRGTNAIFERAWKVKQDLEEEAAQDPNKRQPPTTPSAPSKRPRTSKETTPPSKDVDKKEVISADKAIEATMHSYREAMSNANNIVAAVTGKSAEAAEWKWLSESNPMMKELTKTIEAVEKAASCSFIRPMRTGIKPKDHKKSFDKETWVSEVQRSTKILDPVVTALQKRCATITRMHAQSRDES